MRKARTNYTPVEKLAILRRHLLGRVPVLPLCVQFQLHPTVFYRWLKQFFDDGAAALQRRSTTVKPLDRQQRRTAALQRQLTACHAREKERQWMISLTQGQFSAEEIRRAIGDALSTAQVRALLTCIRNKPLKYRNRAAAVLAGHNHIRVGHIARFLGVSHSSVDAWLHRFSRDGCGVLAPFRSAYCKANDKLYRDAVFETLHAPPLSHGVNRTTWRQEDIQSVMAKRGLPISRHSIRKIIKDAGYQYRRAKQVLTSNDPHYKDKLRDLTRILQHLGLNEKFFSIDEYGPFAIKVQGGRCLVPRGHARTVPRRQRSKGALIVTAALELSTNQITHLYSLAKNTSEMVKLLHALVRKYAGEKYVYFSWDAASWHASKALNVAVNEINSGKAGPKVKLVPLPSCAQFLNVIESVFSGMARAIIHNSDYSSVDAAQKAIDRYFAERNEHFSRHPARAGQKIWGKERVLSEFSASHNCKDPKYR